MTNKQSAGRYAPRLLRNMAFLKSRKNIAFRNVLRVSKNDATRKSCPESRSAGDGALPPASPPAWEVRRADEERDHQQPHAVADGIHEDDKQPEKSENGGGDAEDGAGESDNEHKKP